MAKDVEQQSLRDIGKRKRRYRRIKGFFICAVIFAILAVGVTYLMRIFDRTYNSFSVMNTVESSGPVVGYLSYGASVVRYSRDGAVAIDRNGKLLWNGSFEMNEPIATTQGQYVAIADRGNKLVHIFNNKGAVSSISTLYNIIKIDIASQGVIAVLMEEGDVNHIHLYDKQGETLIEIETNVRVNGYPIDIALSEDGTKLATSYLSVKTGAIESYIAFRNFGEVGKNFTNRLVGGYPLSDVIVPKVEFLTNDTVAIYMDNGFQLYSIKETPSLVYEKTFERKIQSVFHNEKYTGFVLEETEGNPHQQLLLYDIKGNKILDQKLDFKYDKILLSGEDIILHNNLSCIILKTNGKEKFRTSFTSNVMHIFPINNIDRYYLVGNSDVSEILLEE